MLLLCLFFSLFSVLQQISIVVLMALVQSSSNSFSDLHYKVSDGPRWKPYSSLQFHPSTETESLPRYFDKLHIRPEPERPFEKKIESSQGSQVANHPFWTLKDSLKRVRVSHPKLQYCTDQTPNPQQFQLRPPIFSPPGSFTRWMSSLRRRAARRPTLHQNTSGLDHITSKIERLARKPSTQASTHRISTSESSFKFVSAVRSASASLASTAALARSRRTPRRSHCRSKTDRSSKTSFTGLRTSEDSALLERPPLVDAAAAERSMQRRRILEELIATEESYIGDVRSLMNVCLFASTDGKRLNRCLGLCYHPGATAHSTCRATILYQSEPR